MTPPPTVTSGSSSTYRRGLHIVACITACTIFPLVIVGAGVTSKEAGMAFPDWPTSSGHLINPPAWWQQEATRWEHGHRLIGWTVGMLAILLVLFSWSNGGRIRFFGLATLIAISIQGVLGGLRVTEISTTLAMLHGIWGQLCFCLACVMALMVSRDWTTPSSPKPIVAGDLLQRLCLFTAIAIFIQLVLGSALRHFHVDVALILHLIWVVVVTLGVGWVMLWVIGLSRGRDLLHVLGWSLGLLMAVQLLLGGMTLIVTRMGGVNSYLLTWAIPSAHVAIGALLLACSIMLVMTAYRGLRTAKTRSSDTSVARVAIS